MYVIRYKIVAGRLRLLILTRYLIFELWFSFASSGPRRSLPMWNINLMDSISYCNRQPHKKFAATYLGILSLWHGHALRIAGLLWGDFTNQRCSRHLRRVMLDVCLFQNKRLKQQSSFLSYETPRHSCDLTAKCRHFFTTAYKPEWIYSVILVKSL